MIETLIGAGLVVSGVFTITLGSVHFFFPHLLDFKTAIPKTGTPLKPFRLGPIRYTTQRRDVHGVAWVMNHAASYVLVTIGLLEISWWLWLPTPTGRLVSLWIGGWWFIRAASQLYLWRRRGDWLILLGFASLGIWHLMAAALL